MSKSLRIVDKKFKYIVPTLRFIRIRTIINIIRYLTALALTLITLPIILIVHSFFMFFDPPSFRKEKIAHVESYNNLKFDCDDVIFVDKLFITKNMNIIPFALYVEYDTRRNDGKISKAGWYHQDRLGNITFNDILQTSNIQIESVTDLVATKKSIINEINKKTYECSFTPNYVLKKTILDIINNCKSEDFSMSLRLHGCNRLPNFSDTEKLYLAWIMEDPHGNKNQESVEERGEDRFVWKIDPNDKEIMRFIKTLLEYNVLGITSYLEKDSGFSNLQNHFVKIGLSESSPNIGPL